MPGSVSQKSSLQGKPSHASCDRRAVVHTVQDAYIYNVVYITPTPIRGYERLNPYAKWVVAIYENHPDIVQVHNYCRSVPDAR